VQACAQSAHPYLVLLGLLAYKTHPIAISDDAIGMLLTHTDPRLQQLSIEIVRTTMAHNGTLLSMLWQRGDDHTKRLLIAPILRHDAALRAVVWQSTCSLLRHQVIAVLQTDMRAECQVVRNLCASEIAHLESWIHDTRLQNRFHVNDVIGMWQHLSRASA
jgi:hypothetical protein